MVNKKDILELKRRFKKEECTFTRMCGCYVDAGKEKLVKFNESFLNLEDEEFYKYLEIAKKALSGNLGNNLLELSFPLEEEAAGGKQQFFLALRESKLKNEDLLDRFYDLVIENYEYAGNYLILLFHDAYDVMTKTNDNLKLDESEEVFEYLLCAICPVCLSKPGLGYLADENRIGPRIRDWVVSVPETGILFPTFSDRSTDIHSVTYYVRDPKDSRADFVENALGCGSKRTATEQKQVFHAVVKKALAPIADNDDEILLDIQESIQNRLDSSEEAALSDEAVSIPLTSALISEVLAENEIPDSAASEIRDSLEEYFGDELPPMKNVIDEKTLENNAKLKKEQSLVEQVDELKRELVEKSFSEQAAEDEQSGVVATYDVILRVKPEKANQIKAQTVDGHKCLLIPMEDNEYVNVNGINTKL